MRHARSHASTPCRSRFRMSVRAKPRSAGAWPNAPARPSSASDADWAIYLEQRQRFVPFGNDEQDDSPAAGYGGRDGDQPRTHRGRVAPAHAVAAVWLPSDKNTALGFRGAAAKAPALPSGRRRYCGPALPAKHKTWFLVPGFGSLVQEKRRTIGDWRVPSSQEKTTADYAD